MSDRPIGSVKALLLLISTLSIGAAESDKAPHAKIIRSWDDGSFARGRELYEVLCITCHGTPEKEGTLPTSRPFWKEPFKNGNDPYSIYKTLANGLGQMPAWTFLTPEQRYDAIHYIREAFVRPHNPAAYFKVDGPYLASLPEGMTEPAANEPPPRKNPAVSPNGFWACTLLDPASGLK